MDNDDTSRKRDILRQAERVFEDPLSELMEGQGIGEWTGSGQGQIGSRRFFDITYSVSDTTEALPIVQEHLRKLGAGPSTELLTSDGNVYRLG